MDGCSRRGTRSRRLYASTTTPWGGLSQEDRPLFPIARCKHLNLPGKRGQALHGSKEHTARDSRLSQRRERVRMVALHGPLDVRPRYTVLYAPTRLARIRHNFQRRALAFPWA